MTVSYVNKHTKQNKKRCVGGSNTDITIKWETTDKYSKNTNVRLFKPVPAPIYSPLSINKYFAFQPRFRYFYDNNVFILTFWIGCIWLFKFKYFILNLYYWCYLPVLAGTLPKSTSKCSKNKIWLFRLVARPNLRPRFYL